MYKTEKTLRRELKVRYPVEQGARLVLRTELDWDQDLDPDSTSDHGQTAIFTLECKKPFIYFKAGLRTGDKFQWSVGPNLLAVMTHQGTKEVYPFFNSTEGGTFTEILELDSEILGRTHKMRVFTPPGYSENTLQYYPVLFMQDGKNLFFPQEAFMGSEWGVDESLELLNKMTSIDKVLVVGIWSHDRIVDYTKPGYEKYGESLVKEIMPDATKRFRLLRGPTETAVAGSSLGGVVSFYLAWQYPEIFGVAMCMSSTFSYHDDLVERVLSEPIPKTKFYLDSGWPGDNFEVTLAMAMALSQRGCVQGRDFLHVMFPLASHNEKHWGERLHLPLQLFLGRTSTASRGRYA